jgi:dTDP-L-rhamnose 4-epimerase
VRVLVTGGAGFIGSHTVDELLRRGYDVRVLDALRPPVHVDGQRPDYLPDAVDFIYGDVRDRAAWERALKGVNAVYHLAAYQDYLPDFSTFFHINTVSTALLYEVAVAQRLPLEKVVVASSQAVYGEGKYRCEHGHAAGEERFFPQVRPEAQLIEKQWEPLCPVCGQPLTPVSTDEATVSPHNQYAVSKYTQELVAFNLGQRYGIPTVCMRYSIVQGARQSFRNAYSGLLRIFTQRLLHGKPPVCYEDGQQIRDYVSVHDVVRANVLVLEDARADYQVFNVGGNRQVRVLEYARLIAERAGVPIEPQVPGLYRFGDTRHVFSDTRKLSALGWEPQWSLEEIVDEYVAWAKAQPAFGDYSTEAEAHMAAQGTVRRALGAVVAS